VFSLAEALAITPDARCVTTASKPYTIVHTNKAWSELTGWKFTEVVGKSCTVLQGPDTSKEALELLHDAVAANRAVKTQLVNYTKAGKPIMMTIDCAPVTGGSHFCATLTAKPITDGSVAPTAGTPTAAPLAPLNCVEMHACKRHKRDTQLMRLVDVMANTSDPIVLCAKEYPHVITHPNLPWLEMCGYTLEEVEGLTNNILTGPDTDPAVIADLLECVRREEPSVQALVNYKKGGEPFVNQVKTLPVYDEYDELAGFMSMLREVSETAAPPAAAVAPVV